MEQQEQTRYFTIRQIARDEGVTLRQAAYAAARHGVEPALGGGTLQSFR